MLGGKARLRQVVACDSRDRLQSIPATRTSGGWAMTAPLHSATWLACVRVDVFRPPATTKNGILLQGCVAASSAVAQRGFAVGAYIPQLRTDYVSDRTPWM